MMSPRKETPTSPEHHGIERIQQETTAGEAQIEAREAGVAFQVERNVGLAHEAAEQAASSAKMHGPKLTGEPSTAVEQFHSELSEKTNEAVAEGHHDVESAKNVGIGYVEQAKVMAENVLATAQSYLPTSLGGSTESSGTRNSKTGTTILTESASAAAASIASSVQAGATNVVGVAKDLLASARDTGVDSVPPHVGRDKAREFAGRVADVAGAGPDNFSPASSTGIPATSAPLENQSHTIESHSTTISSGTQE